jgi:hypothetical protein
VGEKIFRLADEGNVDALKPLLDEWRGNPIIHWTNRYDDDNTPLLTACARGHAAVVELLLSQPNIGDSVNQPNNEGDTPVQYACAGGHTKTAVMLLDRGANLHHEAKVPPSFPYFD